MKKQTTFWITSIAGIIIILGIIGTLAAQNPIPGISNQSLTRDTTMMGGGIGGGNPLAYADMAESARTMVDEYIPSPLPPSSVAQAGDYIIRNGSVDITVRNVENSVSELTSIASQYGGDILNRAINEYDERTTGYVQMRVDAKQFDAAIAAVKNIATVVNSEQISSEDVTTAVIDIQARLNNAKSEEQAYIELLDRANTVEEILQVQNYLSNVRSMIESYEAQLEYYTSRTDYSVIYVNLSEETSVQFESNTFRPLQSVIDAAQTVVEIAQGAIIGLIYLIIVGGAIAIPVGLITFAVVMIVRNKQNNKKKKK